MDTGKTLHGGINLAFDAAKGTVQMVEEMHRNIAATPWPLDRSPEGPAPGIAGFVYRSIRKVADISHGLSDSVLASVSPMLDRRLPPGPHREAAISALNGLCGDHLARSGNKLAIPMRLRVLLPPEEPSGNAAAPEGDCDDRATPQQVPFANLFEVHKRPVEIHPEPQALADKDFKARKHILLLAHGLCMSDREWTSQQHNHAEALAEHNDYTPVYAHYNSGLNVSSNGRELCDQITGLLEVWPVAVESITFIGFSMGGLVARSAMHMAKRGGHAWLDKVNKAVYIGTPHHGSALERGGFWLQKTLSYSPYTAPLTALGRVRSDGITDLRHGNLCDDDWQHHDEHEDNADYRRPIPLPEGIQHFAIAATLSRRSDRHMETLSGDGLVHPASATGRHEHQHFELDFPAAHTAVFDDLGHLAMLHDARVLCKLREWLDHN